MSLINVNPKPACEMVNVNYLGGTMDIPAHHSWVGAAKITVCGVRAHALLSFAERPAVTANGSFDLSAGTNDFCVLQEVGLMPTGEQTLRKVNNLTSDDILQANVEELTYKVRSILEDETTSVDEKLADLLCSTHGVFPEFMAHQVPTALAAAEEEIEAESKLETGPQFAEAALGDLPPEVKHFVEALSAQGATVHVHRIG